MTGLFASSFRFRGLALLLLLGGLAAPLLHVSQPIYDLVAVMDITGSMNTRDQYIHGLATSRLAMEKAALRAMLPDLPCGSRLGIAIFVERRPFLLLEPIETCENFAVLAAEIDGIDWKAGWDSESHIAFALASAVPMAKALNADLIFMTDGQEEPPLSWTGMPNFAPIRGTTHGLIVGVGGYAFSPIPRFDKAGQEIGVWKPGELPQETGGIFRGHEYLSAVDEPHLRELAGLSSMNYVHLSDVNGLMADFSAAVPRRLRAGEIDLAFAPAALALLLLFAAATREASFSRLGFNVNSRRDRINKRDQRALLLGARPASAERRML